MCKLCVRTPVNHLSVRTRPRQRGFAPLHAPFRALGWARVAGGGLTAPDETARLWHPTSVVCPAHPLGYGGGGRPRAPGKEASPLCTPHFRRTWPGAGRWGARAAGARLKAASTLAPPQASSVPPTRPQVLCAGDAPAPSAKGLRPSALPVPPHSAGACHPERRPHRCVDQRPSRRSLSTGKRAVGVMT